MKYDFTSIPDRSNCGSSKWNAMPGASTECVPMSTADMEFPTAPEIAEALKNTIDTTILGYTDPTDAYYDAVCGWMKRRHNFTVTPRQIVLTPGVVYALGLLIDALSNPGDSVIILTPVYYPFDMAVLAKERNIIYSELKQTGSRYTIDYADLEKKASHKKARLLLFCNPHNPVGRVWDKDELNAVVDICARNGVFIIDDEIHHDLIMPGFRHTVMASLSETASRICAVCTAPSKTFNLAGMQCSNIIIQDPDACKKVRVAAMLTLSTHLNILAYAACQAAYNHCESWLEELIQTVSENAKYIKDFMAEHFPEITVFPLEGTYLLWVDCRALGMTHLELEKLMKEEAGLWLDEGYIFGPAGRGFERFNIACSPVTVRRSMERFKAAVEKQRAIWETEGKPYHKTLAVGDKLDGFIYDTPSATALNLAKTIRKPTLIIFSRYYSCTLCKLLIARITASYPAIRLAGYDVKVVLQSTQTALEKTKYPFDIICDPKAKLYDRYNVFEADSDLSMVATSPGMIKLMGGIRKMANSMYEEQKSEGRSRQLPAVFLIDIDMTVKYAYYGKTVDDIPEILKLIVNKK